MTMGSEPPLLEARGIAKRFGAVLANEVAHFSVHRGEVLGLLGENGAGKSTLAKILYGYYTPDAGEIFVDGKPVAIASPRDARALGIGMVFQNFTLIPALSVLDNVALFQKNLPAVVPRQAILERMRHYAKRFHLAVDPWMPARQLAVGDQQKVEILKQLLAGARVLILDEPTKVLAPQESEGLFKTLGELRACHARHPDPGYAPGARGPIDKLRHSPFGKRDGLHQSCNACGGRQCAAGAHANVAGTAATEHKGTRSRTGLQLEPRGWERQVHRPRSE